MGLLGVLTFINEDLTDTLSKSEVNLISELHLESITSLPLLAIPEVCTQGFGIYELIELPVLRRGC